MSTDPAALRQEITADPKGLGYAALVASGNDAGLAALLNAAGATSDYLVYKTAVPIADLVANIDPTNFAALTALQIAKLQLLFAGAATLNAADANTRSIVQGIFAGMAATLAKLNALVQRQGSRAEVLWGAGVHVTHADVAKALRGS